MNKNFRSALQYKIVSHNSKVIPILFQLTLHKNWSFPLRISSVNETNSLFWLYSEVKSTALHRSFPSVFWRMSFKSYGQPCTFSVYITLTYNFLLKAFLKPNSLRTESFLSFLNTYSSLLLWLSGDGTQAVVPVLPMDLIFILVIFIVRVLLRILIFSIQFNSYLFSKIYIYI